MTLNDAAMLATRAAVKSTVYEEIEATTSAAIQAESEREILDRSSDVTGICVRLTNSYLPLIRYNFIFEWSKSS